MSWILELYVCIFNPPFCSSYYIYELENRTACYQMAGHIVEQYRLENIVVMNYSCKQERKT